MDATVGGSAASSINHSCDPSCYSRPIIVENGRPAVAICATRHVKRGEALSDYFMFPLDEASTFRCGYVSAR